MESEDEDHSGHGDYCPSRSLVNALSDWLPQFNSPGTQGLNPGAQERVDLEDLLLLADFYYLPYEYGKEAVRLIRMLTYCISHYQESESSIWTQNMKDILALSSRIHKLTGDYTGPFFF